MDKRITELSRTESIDALDLFVVATDPTGSPLTQSVRLSDLEANLNHNNLMNYVANEHIDWTASQVTPIHADNYTDTTYVASDFNHDDLSAISGGAVGEYNHITDAELTVLQATSGSNTGDQSSGDFDHNALVNTHNLTTDIDHDALTNFVANEHIDWTNATDNFLTTGLIGVGANASPEVGFDRIVNVKSDTYETTNGLDHIYTRIIKTAGVTDVDNHFTGVNTFNLFDQSGGVIGNMQGGNFTARIIDGDVGDSSNERILVGIRGLADMDGGKVYGSVYGLNFFVDQEAGNEVTGDIMGATIRVDADGTVGGNVYMLYLNENNNVDYGIYQSGTAENVLGGMLTVDNNLYVSKTSTAGDAIYSGRFRTYSNPTGGVISVCLDAEITANNTVASSGSNGIRALSFNAGTPATDVDFTRLVAIGLRGGVSHKGTGVLGDARGAMPTVRNMSTGTITNGYGIRHYLTNESTGTITNLFGEHITLDINSGTITNIYGLYIGDLSKGTQTNIWGIYQSDVNASNYFAGDLQAGSFKSSDGSVGVTGTATPTKTLTVKNGLITAIT